MISLQIGLAIAGGVVLAGVVAHSTWTARKNLPKRATPEVEQGQQIEPALPSEPHDPQDPLAQRQEPRFDADPSLDALAALMTVDPKPGLDALIDVIALVVIESVVSGEAALAAMPSTRRAGSKPFGVEGLSVDQGVWEFPATGQRYSAFQCGVQLANRLGALNQIEYSEFVMKAQAFADAIGGEPEFPDMLEEVARARELDQFASAHDAQISFTLRAINTAWSPGYVQQRASRLGFVAAHMPGRMVLAANQQGAHILELSFDTQAAMSEDPEETALREVSLSLDVPQVLRSERPFVRLREAALALAASMEGVIIDDNANPINLNAMDVISSELEMLYDTLDARDLSAGSVLARRLFS